MAEGFDALLATQLYGNSVMGWGLAAGAAVLVYAALRIVQCVWLAQLRRLAEKLHIDKLRPVIEALEKTKRVVLLAIALSAGAQMVMLPPKAETAIALGALLAFLVQGGVWIMAFLDAWMNRYRDKHLASNPGAISSLNAVRVILKGAVWICILLVVLQNFGVDVTALITGLGIGGIAVALAVQNILGDLFASLTIVVDKPFVVGDFLILGEHMGAVEHIGLKNTRLRSLSGEQIILSNSDLLGSRIRNYGRMFERRVPITIGVTYQTPRDKLKAIPGIIKAAIEAQDKTRFDRAHFKGYGASSIDFEYVYYVKGADYALFMDINQAINLTLHEEFEKLGIDFAYPTQTLFIEKVAGLRDVKDRAA